MLSSRLSVNARIGVVNALTGKVSAQAIRSQSNSSDMGELRARLLNYF